MSQTKIERHKKTAKSWKKKLRVGDPELLLKVRKCWNQYEGISDETVGEQVTLTQIQHVLAKEEGFKNWLDLITQLGGN